MVKKTIPLGSVETGYRYEVSLVIDAGSSKFIEMTEGSGMLAAGGHFALIDLLKPTWDAHLEVCGALWLREMANLDPAPTFEDVLAELEKRKKESGT